MIKNRMIAYVIDMFIVTLISSIIFTLPVFERNQEEYLNTYESYMNNYTSYLNGELTNKEMIESEYKTMEESSDLFIIKIATTIVYFAIIPFYSKGQTIGKKITKIKVISNNNKEINPGLFFLRGILSSMVLFELIDMFALLLTDEITWYLITTITAYLSYIAYVTMLLTASLTKEHRALHDMITNTKIVSAKTQQ